MTLLLAAPASTANLGSGFDCAAVALDLWNELELEPGDGTVEIEGEGASELPRDATHLALRAFASFADPSHHSFRFVNRIPLERGLGASASAIALGLAAGAAAAGVEPTEDELLSLGAALEGHADNMAAALAGGACLVWRDNGHLGIARVAGDLPFAAIAVIPETRTATAVSRDTLPRSVSHPEAAAAAGRAALLGAGLATGDPDLLRRGFHDVLHEPYRAKAAPLLHAIRSDLPAGAVATTLSGSGPSVIVWTEPDAADACAAELTRRFADARVLRLAVASSGVRAEEVVA
jgi:homoserine kinase